MPDGTKPSKEVDGYRTIVSLVVIPGRKERTHNEAPSLLVAAGDDLGWIHVDVSGEARLPRFTNSLFTWSNPPPPRHKRSASSTLIHVDISGKARLPRFTNALFTWSTRSWSGRFGGKGWSRYLKKHFSPLLPPHP